MPFTGVETLLLLASLACGGAAIGGLLAALREEKSRGRRPQRR